MQRIKNDQSGFGAVELIVVIVIVALLGVSGWVVYKNQKKTTEPTTNTDTTNTTPDTTENWKKVDSIGGAYSMKVPDGWDLTNYPGNVLNGDGIAFAEGTPAVIATGSSSYAGDQKKFNVGFTNRRSAEDTAPQWQSPNQFGTEAVEDFSLGSIKGKRYSIEFTETVTGVTKGDKVYQYVFELPNDKGLGVVYMQKAGDTDNLKTVEQAIRTIVIN